MSVLRPVPLTIVAAVLGVAPGAAARAASPAFERLPIVITEKLFHLGDSAKPEWRRLATVLPSHGTQLELDFQGEESSSPLTLEIRAGDVEQAWAVKVNGEKLGDLSKSKEVATQYFEVRPGVLKAGLNRLLISGEKIGDDILVGKATLHDRSLAELKGYAAVDVEVVDGETHAGLPCRITVTKLSGRRAEAPVTAPTATPGAEPSGGGASPLVRDWGSEALAEVALGRSGGPDAVAYRKGIVYTRDGRAQLGLAPGRYAIYATRGFEYGLGVSVLELEERDRRDIRLELRREVDTTGYLAADTHIHTLTYSKHGDISVEERVITIAGEGIEVAVATDHNHHTDYAPTMRKLAVDDRYAALVGNEVTTDIGHFTAFPMDPTADPPDHDHRDWTLLMAAMRAAPGVRAVILNHPRRKLGKLDTLEMIGFEPLSGEARAGPQDLGLDAIEVLNGKTLDPDSMLTVRDWFGLLNRGYRIAAVAGSDSHAIAEIVGQTRSYVRSATDDPRTLQLDDFLKSFAQGRILVSLGLLVSAEVDGRFREGDLATDLPARVSVRIGVQAPSWTRATSIALYFNGTLVREEAVPSAVGPLRHEVTWTVPRPGHDAYLVVVATGPPVTAPYWPLDGGEKAYVLGLNNPVWLDGDGDGKFTSAREYAAAIAHDHPAGDPAGAAALAAYDDAVAIQYASLQREAVQREAQLSYELLLTRVDAQLGRLREAAPPLSLARAAIEKYLTAAPTIDVLTRLERAAAAREREKEEKKARERQEARAKAREEARRRAEEKKAKR